MQITITGQTPAQKNGKTVGFNKYTNRTFVASSKIVKDWQESAAWQLKGFKYPGGQKSVDIVIYNKDKRLRDLDNQATSCLDALVKAGVIEDDNCYVINELRIRFAGVDKENPRAEITIKANEIN